MLMPMPGNASSESYPFCMASLYRLSLLTSRCQPVSLDASLTFCPRLPMATDRKSSGTITSMDRLSSSMMTLDISAGARALQTNFAESICQGMMSIFSPRNSWTTFCTRLPFIPTQAPTGSMSESLDATANFARLPGSRAAPLISTMPSLISGTSVLNRLIRKFGWVRDNMIWGPRLSWRISMI